MTEIHDHDDFGGFSRDIPSILSRRRMLVLTGAGLVLAACGSTASDTASAPTTGAASSTDPATTESATTTGAPATSAPAGPPGSGGPPPGGPPPSGGFGGPPGGGGPLGTSSPPVTSPNGECSTIPQETAGPYPGDGSNGPNVLKESGVVRRDIRSSIAGATGKAEGIALEVTFNLIDVAGNCVPLPNAAIYAWHCDREGRYSLYSPGVTTENYLRGVQVADDKGQVNFTTIFPAAYTGRWPHIHFEVYASVDDATSGKSPTSTSQIALPVDACNAVYATAGYEASVANMAQTPLASDMVFGDDDGVRETPTITGDVKSGYAVALTVPV